MKASLEREQFSQRLQQALREADYSPDSPTQLAREFNVRFAGRPVTVHAARKWLVGEAIPTQEKLRILSQWLGISAEWLRYGSEEQAGANGNAHPSSHFESSDIKLLAEMQSLNEADRKLAREFIRMLVRMERQK
jgi:transcriptional regulator with XRE-family HTH domain